MSGNAQENQKHQPTKPPPETNHTTVRLIPSRNPAPVASGPNSVPHTTEPATNQPFPKPHTPTPPGQTRQNRKHATRTQTNQHQPGTYSLIFHP
jgi:hypothetical protein